jgi:C4-dicarboxylate-specific signal transduction histidine kinase
MDATPIYIILAFCLVAFGVFMWHSGQTAKKMAQDLERHFENIRVPVDTDTLKTSLELKERVESLERRVEEIARDAKRMVAKANARLRRARALDDDDVLDDEPDEDDEQVDPGTLNEVMTAMGKTPMSSNGPPGGAMTPAEILRYARERG